jgi:hypothetical protein
MAKMRIPLRPVHPDRICWGCDKYCPADDLACGNGTIRTLHPCELFGDDWLEWFESDRSGSGAPHPPRVPSGRTLDGEERV